MSYITRRKRIRHAMTAGLCLVALTMAIYVAYAVLRASLHQTPMAKATASSVEQAVVHKQVEALPPPIPCEMERTMRPGGSDTRLYPLLEQYVRCAYAGLSQAEMHAQCNRLVDAFEHAFPDADVDNIPPGVMLRLEGAVGSENFNPRYSGLETPIP